MKSNAPRRYVVDEMGRHVLIGLTYEEMLELQRVDSRQTGQPRGRPDAANRNDPGMAHDELSWQELYSKHDRSWNFGWRRAGLSGVTGSIFSTTTKCLDRIAEPVQFLLRTRATT